MIRNANVIASEECVAGHKLVITDVTVGVLKKRKAVKYVPKLRVWKLKKQPFRDAYANEVKRKALEIKNIGRVNDKWMCMKNVLLEAVEKVVRKTKGRARHKETWWWNEN